MARVVLNHFRPALTLSLYNNGQTGIRTFRTLLFNSIPTSFNLPTRHPPAGLRAMSTTKAPILFYTFGASPNGQQIAILLEELKAAYPNNANIEWEKRIVDLKADEQKEDWYIKVRFEG